MRVPDPEEGGENDLCEPTDEHVHALDGILGVEITLDALRRFFRKEFTHSELGIVEAPIRGNVARNAFLFCEVNQEFLAVHHDTVVVRVAAYDNVASMDE